MNESLPLVTIAIPFYNPGSYIIDTLHSIYQQDYGNIELILYNDGSVDDSNTLVTNWIEGAKQRFHNVILLQGITNKGVGHACDVLLQKSTGLYFQMLGADDLVYSNKITRQVNYLQHHPACALIYGNMDRIDEKDSKYQQDYFTYQQFRTFKNNTPPSGAIFADLVKENFIPASSVLVRKSVIEAVGGYDASLKSEDWDLWLRISKLYQVCGERDIVGAYRILPTSAMHASKNKIFVLESLNAALVKHKGISTTINREINDHLYNNTIEMYRLGYISKKWAKQLLSYKIGIKPFAYLLLMAAGIKLNQKR